MSDERSKNPVLSDVERDLNLKSKAFEKLKGYVAKEKIIDNLKWHRRFLLMADHIAQWSKDPSTKCGAVIVDDKQRIISLGYNGPPRGIKDTQERLNDRQLKYDLTIHAEMNAILFANVSLEGSILYVSPMAPCIRCAVHIIQTGISTVVFPKLPKDKEERWGESVKLSKQMFEEVGIKWVEI